MRLALHTCDNTLAGEAKRKAEGKKHIKCATGEEISSYFESNIVGLDMLSYSATLGNDYKAKNKSTALFE